MAPLPTIGLIDKAPLAIALQELIGGTGKDERRTRSDKIRCRLATFLSHWLKSGAVIQDGHIGQAVPIQIGNGTTG